MSLKIDDETQRTDGTHSSFSYPKHSSSNATATPSTNVPEVCISTCSMVCRICQSHSNQEVLISPCNCKGTLAHVHLPCLERWLNQASRTYCELCMYRFNSVQTLRYSCLQSMCLWIQHPRNRSHFQSDVVIAALLTTVTIGLMVVCVLGMQYFVIEARKMGVSQGWTKGFVSGFLIMILLGYVITLYLIAKDQFVPWYHWWRNTFDIKLVIEPATRKITSKVVKDTCVWKLRICVN